MAGFAQCSASLARFTSGERKSNTANRIVIARLAAGIFFPQRPTLRLTPHSYSPSVLGKILRASARESSFQEAAEALDDLAEVTISSRQASRIAHEVGQQLQAERDQQVAELRACQLKPQVETRPALAVVGVDGGRLQIRGEGTVPGLMTRRGGKIRSRWWLRRRSLVLTRIPAGLARLLPRPSIRGEISSWDCWAEPDEPT